MYTIYSLNIMQSVEEVHLMQEQSLKNVQYFYNYALLTTANLSIGFVATCISIYYISKKM